jgi:hypothetical protein
MPTIERGSPSNTASSGKPPDLAAQDDPPLRIEARDMKNIRPYIHADRHQ